MKRMRNHLAGVLVALVLTGCGNGQGDEVVTTTRQDHSLQITLTTVSSTRLGDFVPITLTVKNISSETITAMLGGSPEAIALVKQGDTEIWSWATGKFFPAGLSSPYLILPNETRKYDLGWDQKDSAGKQVESGIYMIEAWFNTYTLNGTDVLQQKDLAAEPVEVSIR